jgi:hypothetical protein
MFQEVVSQIRHKQQQLQARLELLKMNRQPKRQRHTLETDFIKPRLDLSRSVLSSRSRSLGRTSRSKTPIRSPTTITKEIRTIPRGVRTNPTLTTERTSRSPLRYTSPSNQQRTSRSPVQRKSQFTLRKTYASPIRTFRPTA